MNNGFLLQAIIYLGAAVICVPIAKRLGMGSVLGYLLAGIIIGPFLLGFIGEEGEDIMHFAEFGVVMMLFLIGLELEPDKLWKIRTQIFGVGLSQLGITALIFFLIGLLFQFQWQSSLAIGLSLALSSTAIVLQSLKEKNQMNTAAGQNSFAVLLFQDIAVIPILALLPLLAFQPVTGNASAGHSILSGLPGWIQTISLIGAVTIVVLIGKFAIVPLLSVVAKTRLRELFAASALLIVVGIAFLMELVGLSPALGTFLAGVILANSSFKHELETDLEPFKGLLLGLFFIAVGASINFSLIGNNPSLIISVTLGIIFIKTVVLFCIGRFSKISIDQNLIFSIGLSQVGEFAFVLFSLIRQLNILSPDNTGLMMAATALSMTITPILILLNEKFILPRFGTKEKEDRKTEVIEERHGVIIAGFSHYGSTIGRFLRANGVNATILDQDSDMVDLLRKMGFKVYYGDATRADLLASAGAEDAKILVSGIDSPETNFRLVKTVQKHFPHLELMIRSKNRFDAFELMSMNIKHIYREHLDTSVRMGTDVLRKLGFRAYSVQRAAQNFIKYDEQALQELVEHRHDRKQYISIARRQIKEQEELLNNDLIHKPSLNDHAWDSEKLKETAKIHSKEKPEKNIEKIPPI